MLQEKTLLWAEGEYTYEAADGALPCITSYIHDDGEVRPAAVVVPGGGFHVLAPTEGGIVAQRFYEMGYQAFTVGYSINPGGDRPLKKQPLKDVSRAVVWVRKNAGRLKVDPDRVAILGFSAGGHVSANLCVHFDDEILEETGEYAGISNRPDAAVLSYPAIILDKEAPRESFFTLLGRDASDEEFEYMSAEKHVTSKTPPTFIWTTMTDEVVPCENSFAYAKALRDAGVTAELHVFDHGCHAMSLADETWADFERRDRGIDVKPDKAISAWPLLADAWLKNNL